MICRCLWKGEGEREEKLIFAPISLIDCTDLLQHAKVCDWRERALLIGVDFDMTRHAIGRHAILLLLALGLSGLVGG